MESSPPSRGIGKSNDVQNIHVHDCLLKDSTTDMPLGHMPRAAGLGGGRGAGCGVWGDLPGKGKYTLSTELIDGVMYENIQIYVIRQNI